MIAVKILLHTCCAPCLIYPSSILQDQGKQVTAYFYNPNIHPFREFRKRYDSLKLYSDSMNLPLISEETYGLKDFLRKIVFHENERCSTCYSMRLIKTALLAKDLGFDAFTTTLLYSKYQHHAQIKSLCENVSTQYNIPFIYQDYREGWLLGVDKARELNMYRQSYCGCIYSEQERYDKSSKQPIPPHNIKR